MDSLTRSQKDEIKVIFDTLDTTNSGTILASDLSLVIRGWGDTSITDAEVTDIVAEIDVNASGGNGTIDYEEFVHMFTRTFVSDCKIGVDESEEQDLHTAFDTLDIDQDGVLNGKDLQVAFAKQGDEYSMMEIEEMINEVDSTGKNQINRDDFIKTITP